MRVVSNTSPLSNLAIIGHLGLVREQLGIVLIPPTVRTEARFFVNPALEKALIISVGEN
jgi:predicted nucleic acid-binding protein